MKSVLLHVFEDKELDDRLSVALDVCRAHDAHLTCAYVTPYASYVGLDPMGGVFTSGALIDSLRETEGRVRTKLAASVTLVSVSEDGEEFPSTDASAYLSRHGIASDLRTFTDADGAPDNLIVQVAKEVGAGTILIGAYGHSRLRETLLGGVTRRLSTLSDIPLLLGH